MAYRISVVLNLLTPGPKRDPELEVTLYLDNKPAAVCATCFYARTDGNLDIPDNSGYKLTYKERLALGLHSNDGVVNGRFTNTMFSCRRCRAEIRRIRNEEKELHSRKLQLQLPQLVLDLEKKQFPGAFEH